MGREHSTRESYRSELYWRGGEDRDKLEASWSVPDWLWMEYFQLKAWGHAALYIYKVANDGLSSQEQYAYWRN